MIRLTVSPPSDVKSIGEQFAGILERFEFDCVAARIEKKHRRLLADRALKTQLRRDDEPDAGCDEFVAHLLPFRHREHETEVTYRHRVTVDAASLAAARLLRRQVGDYLVAVKIEIDPLGI